MMTSSEKLNLSATILGPIIIIAAIGWVNWSFNARMTIERQTADKYNAETYVSKPWFEKSHEETNHRLDTMSVDVSVLRSDVATIKGELSGGIVRTKGN